MAFTARTWTASPCLLGLRRIVCVAGVATAVLSMRGVAQMQTGPAALAVTKTMPAAAPLADRLTVTVGGVSHEYSPRDLEHMPQVSVTVQNGHTKQQENYSGVTVATLLAASGLPETGPHAQLLLRSYLRAQGTDFYFVIYSGSELDPKWHAGTVLVALKRNGEALGRDGHFQLISTEDQRPARWVHNLNQLVLVPLN